MRTFLEGFKLLCISVGLLGVVVCGWLGSMYVSQHGTVWQIRSMVVVFGITLVVLFSYGIGLFLE